MAVIKIMVKTSAWEGKHPAILSSLIEFASKQSCHLRTGRVTLGVAMSQHHWHRVLYKLEHTQVFLLIIFKVIIKIPLSITHDWKTTYKQVFILLCQTSGHAVLEQLKPTVDLSLVDTEESPVLPNWDTQSSLYMRLAY